MKFYIFFFIIFCLSSSFAGDAIKKIEIIGNQRVESETIFAYLPIKVGDSFSADKLDKALKELFATGYFKDVHLDRKEQILIVKVQENPIINKIAFEGNKKLKDDILKTEVHLNPREVLSRDKVQRSLNIILEIYRRMGHFGAHVEPKIINLPENRVNLVFEIQEGSVTHVQSIQFVGNRYFQSHTLEEQLRTKRWRWYRFFAHDDVYDPERFQHDQQSLQKFYNDYGYPEFRLISGVAELMPDQKGFVLTFTVDEGKRYRFGEISIVSHIDFVDVKDLKKLITFSKGSIYSAKSVEKTTNAITDFLATQGFAFVTIRPDYNLKNDQTCDVTLEIKESSKIYIEKIMINGNDRTHDSIIRREVSLHEGDAYNSSKIKQTERRLKDLQYFKTVHVDVEQGSAMDKAIIVVNVEEQPTGELGIAGGFSTLDGPLANLRITQNNFRGVGQTVYGDLTIAKKRQDVSIGFVEPYFLDRPLVLSGDVFTVRSTRFSAYNHITKGFDVGIGYLLNDYGWSQRWNYALQSEDINHVARDSSTVIMEQAGNSLLSSVKHTVTYDKRNSRVEPNEGYIVSLNNTLAGLGGNVNYLRNELNGGWYYPMTENVTLGALGAVGGIDRTTGKRIRIVDSFMLGGPSLRGFEHGLGPIDRKTGDSLGGTRYWNGTIEATFPIGLPSDFGIKGSVFTDMGSSWKAGQKTPETVDKKNMRASVGVGLSWVSPIGPLSMDYALPIKKQPFDATQRFLFGFSTRF
ncbi:MAG: outer membrane protein assembly factor BamA [Alphaproteobacteria bacterium]